MASKEETKVTEESGTEKRTEDEGKNSEEGEEAKNEEVDAARHPRLDRNKELHRIYSTLLEDYPVNLGKAISKKQREREHLKDPTLVYGEIKYNFMALIFQVPWLKKLKKI